MSALPIDEPVVPLPRHHDGGRVIPFPGPGRERATGRGAPPGPPTRRRAARPRLRITRRGRLLLTTVSLAAALAAAGLLAGGAALAGGEAAPEPTRSVVVLPGENLLDVAATVPGQADVRDVAVDIRDLNRLDGSAVRAGQRLLVPLSAD